MKPNSFLGYVLLGLIFGLPPLLLKYKSALATTLVTTALALILSMSKFSISSGYLLLAIVMVSMVLAFKYGLLNEGFLNSNPEEVSELIRKMKGSEGFRTNLNDDPDEELPLSQKMTIEGYEDVKKEKDEKPAPAMKKDEMPMPFKLGEIPSQAKGGPHIDAGSTLMKAIQSLNPDQINAMSKDTQQLIETQKSLMGMLGTMKPMLNDGKELMETFQQMFGK